MTIYYINYILLAIGILTVLTTIILIFLDKLKGDDMYFNIDIKEQEIKKSIEDAEEILSELNFASDVIVKDIEEKISSFNQLYKNINNGLIQVNTEPTAPEPQQTPHIERTTVPVKFKPVTAVSSYRSMLKEEKQKSKQQLVNELAEQGISVIDIAKKMNMGQGEVALILSLKNEEN
ncbi:MAG: hypothetical protein WBL93_13880 [Lutisporaceae bacterium]